MPIRFQSLKGKKIQFSKSEINIINGLKPLTGGEWEGKIKKSSSVKRKDRDALRKDIKDKLIKIQGAYCIYCGIHEDYCGSNLQREHIAPKGKKHYPQFVFDPEKKSLAYSRLTHMFSDHLTCKRKECPFLPNRNQKYFAKPC